MIAGAMALGLYAAGVPFPFGKTEIANPDSGSALDDFSEDALIRAIIQVESGGDPNAEAATSSARGLMQVTRAAAQDVGYDYEALFDPAINVAAGTAYLNAMIDRFGVVDGIRAYYAGPGSIRDERQGIVNQYARDSWAYLSKVRAAMG